MVTGGAERRQRSNRLWAVLAAAAMSVVVATPGSAQTDFVPGRSLARALVVRAGPSQGGLAVAVNLAESMADYQGSVGRGVSTTFGSGVLALIAADVVAQLPPPSRIDSTEEGSEEGRREPFPATPAEVPVGIGAGTQEVSADDDPRGNATTTLGDLQVPGALSVGGARSTATAGIVDGNMREARATVEIPVVELADGMVRLEGMRWRAIQRSGASFPDDVEEDAGFSIARIVLAGQEIATPDTPAEITAAFAQLNAAIAPTGLVLDVPTPGRRGTTTVVSPLVARLASSDVGAAVFGPVFGAAQPVRDAAVAPLLAQVPEAAAGVLVADIVIGALSGAGGVTVEIGGAEARTDGTTYDNPFGSARPRPTASVGAAQAAGRPVAPAAAPAAARPGPIAASPATSGGATAAGELGGDDGPALDQVPVVHDADAGPIGSLLASGLVGALVLAGAEWSRARRGRFSFGEEA